MLRINVQPIDLIKKNKCYYHFINHLFSLYITKNITKNDGIIYTLNILILVEKSIINIWIIIKDNLL